MRAASSTTVFILHIIQTGLFADAQLDQNLNRWFAKIGFVSVGFFIVLSGFILTWTARENDRLLSFWRRRLARFYPSHVLAWAIAMALMAWLAVKPVLGDALPSLFLFQAWTSNEKVFWAVNGPSWSLCGELLFYFAFPWLLRLVRKIPDRRLWLCAGSLVAAIVATALIGGLVVSSTPETPFVHVSWEQQWLVFNHPATRILDFSLGIVMARILQTGRWIRVPLGVAGLTLVPAYLLALWLPNTLGLVAPTVIPLALVITAAAAADLDGKSTVFQRRTVVRLGELAFAFYLTHTLVITFGPIGRSQHTWPLPQALGLIALTYVLSLVVAWALCHGFERPLAKRLGRPRRASAQLAPRETNGDHIPLQKAELKN
ncbi:acyltransferase family protein [Kitasatospora sp. NPDC101155]|uniref:acyltransferase family protein n=1 Tax=Kitasatospora sp. NPDC101155 TaxID=3364097 RepID=UPI0037F9B8D5